MDLEVSVHGYLAMLLWACGDIVGHGGNVCVPGEACLLLHGTWEAKREEKTGVSIPLMN